MELETFSSPPEKKRAIRYAEEESDMPASRRVIRYADDEEAGETSTDARRLQRRLSTISQISTASSQNSATNNSNAIQRARRGSIDPRLGIPIEYRTLSIHVEQTRERNEREQAIKDSLKVKEAAAPPVTTAKPQKKAADGTAIDTMKHRYILICCW